MSRAPKAFRFARAFLILFLICSQAWAQATPKEFVKKAPLAYLRVPLPWQSGGLFSTQQQNKLLGELLPLVTPRANLGAVIRSLLGKMNSSLELCVYPSANQLIPVPNIILSGKTKLSPEDQSLLLKKLIISSAEKILNQKMSWVKFKRVARKDLLTDSVYFFPFHISLHCSPGKFSIILLSDKKQPRPTSKNALADSEKQDPFELIKKNSEADWQKLDQKLGSTKGDFVLHGELGSSLKVYLNLIQNFDKKLWKNLKSYDIDQLEALSLYSKGSRENFSLLGKLRWAGKNHLWSDLANYDVSGQTSRQTGSDFFGAIHLPKISTPVFRKLIAALFPLEEIKAPAYERLYRSLQGPISFSWLSSSPSPLFISPLAKKLSFGLELKNLLKSKVRFTSEKQTKGSLTHLLWQGNTLSYSIENQTLSFSPLLQTLRDFSGELDSEKSKGLISLSYPLHSSYRETYYTSMHFLSQALIANNRGVNPNAFPAFKDLNLKDLAWSELGQVNLEKEGDHSLVLTWKQPYGLPGLLAGMNLKSSHYISFLSLLKMTMSSF